MTESEMVWILCMPVIVGGGLLAICLVQLIRGRVSRSQRPQPERRELH